MAIKAPANPSTSVPLSAQNSKAALAPVRESAKAAKKPMAADRLREHANDNLHQVVQPNEHDPATLHAGEQADVVSDASDAAAGAVTDEKLAAAEGQTSQEASQSLDFGAGPNALHNGPQLAQAQTQSTVQSMSGQNKQTCEESSKEGDDCDRGFLWLPFGGLALAGLASTGTTAAPTPVPVAINTVIGTVVAGPVIRDHSLKVVIFAANGTTKLGETPLDDEGKFSVDIGTYTGVVIARVVNTDTNKND